MPVRSCTKKRSHRSSDMDRETHRTNNHPRSRGFVDFALLWFEIRSKGAACVATKDTFIRPYSWTFATWSEVLHNNKVRLYSKIAF